MRVADLSLAAWIEFSRPMQICRCRAWRILSLAAWIEFSRLCNSVAVRVADLSLAAWIEFSRLCKSVAVRVAD